MVPSRVSESCGWLPSEKKPSILPGGPLQVKGRGDEDSLSQTPEEEPVVGGSHGWKGPDANTLKHSGTGGLPPAAYTG